MATYRKLTIRKILDSRRDKGKNLSNLEVAEWIWSIIEKKLYSFSCVELEQIQYISIEVIEHINGMSIHVNIKDGITKSEVKVKRLSEAFLMSAKKLQNIDEIMTFVRGLAKQNGLEAWDYTEDIPVIGDEKYWWVMWINSDIKP